MSVMILEDSSSEFGPLASTVLAMGKLFLSLDVEGPIVIYI